MRRAVGWLARGLRDLVEREEIVHGEHLGGEQPVQTAEAEGAAAAEEVGDMRGLESCLAREQRPIQTAAIHPAEEFHAESILQLGEVHCGKLASSQRCHRTALSVRNVTAESSCGNRLLGIATHGAVWGGGAGR